ncbi:MAG: S41 family peptidase [Pseudomonadota bacterium]
MIKFYTFIILTFALSACTTQRQSDDLDFMRDQILENHPGIYNTLDPSFKDALEKAYSIARSSIGSSSNQEPIKTALSTFAKSFNDAHLWVRWEDVPKNDAAKIALPEQRQSTFTIKRLTPEITWITLPTFDIPPNQQKEFEHLLKQLPKLKTKGTIVFDLRGNQGGNSEYGDRVVDHLFGEGYANQQRHTAHKNISVDWRASPGNLSPMREMHARYKSDWMKHVADCIEESINLHKPYYHAAPSDILNPNKIVRTHTVKARIFVIIEPLNVSAALDFIDSLKMMNHKITLIGKTTKADRLYMEVRCVNLPSGLGTFSYPIKVYRNRPRGDNVPYIPDVDCHVTDTEKVVECMENINE